MPPPVSKFKTDHAFCRTYIEAAHISIYSSQVH